jgi:hypothetical protein
MAWQPPNHACLWDLDMSLAPKLPPGRLQRVKFFSVDPEEIALTVEWAKGP